jgi:ribosomal protein L40E
MAKKMKRFQFTADICSFIYARNKPEAEKMRQKIHDQIENSLLFAEDYVFEDAINNSDHNIETRVKEIIEDKDETTEVT